MFVTLDRLLVGSPRNGQPNSAGGTQGMLYKCRLHNRLPLNQVCTAFIGYNNLIFITRYLLVDNSIILLYIDFLTILFSFYLLVKLMRLSLVFNPLVHDLFYNLPSK